MQNALKGVNHLLQGEDEFRSDLDACFDNSWLQSTFEVKEKWAKAYVKMSFSVGMTTTRSL